MPEEQNLNRIYGGEGNYRLFNGTLAMNILKCTHPVYNAQFSLTESSLHSVSDMVSMLIMFNNLSLNRMKSVQAHATITVY
jgi:hypothetical protein